MKSKSWKLKESGPYVAYANILLSFVCDKIWELTEGLELPNKNSKKKENEKEQLLKLGPSGSHCFKCY